jgi:hypothetical protein
MSKKNLLLTILGTILFTTNYAQDLHFYLGTVPTIDGIISPAEWDDADTCSISISASLKVKVRYKHDGSNFYFLFYNHLESAVRCPEVNLDINYSKSSTWEGDDWWFHSSGSDCENNGAPNVFSDCMVVQPDWESVPNFVSGGPNEDTVEMHIPFSKAGFSYSGGIDTIGIALDVTNTFSAWNLFPSTATTTNPSTWANGIFYNYTMGIDEVKKETDFCLFPNPATTVLNIVSKNTVKSNLVIYDMNGRPVFERNLGKSPVQWDISHLEPGIYVLRIENVFKKFIKW